MTLIGVDPKGELLWRKDYGTEKFTYIDNIFQPVFLYAKDSVGFYLTVCVRDSLNQQIGVLIRFNFNGDTLWQKIYRETYPKDVIPHALCRSVDGGLLITGGSQDSSGMACLLIKTDLNGNELWRKRINKAAPNVQDGKSIIQDKATKRIIIVGYQYIGDSKSWATYSNILILDSLGNRILQTTYNNAGGGGGFASVIQMKDGNFLTGGSWFAYEINNQPYFNPLLVKFDIEGKVIWKKQYNVTGIYNHMTFFHEMENGDITIFGRCDTSELIAPTKMIRTDALGNIRWQRNVSDPLILAMSIYPTKDKGFICAAVFPYIEGLNPFGLIKIDSLGCDTVETYCTPPMYVGLEKVSTTGNVSIEVFPNPSSSKINIILGSGMVDAFSFRLADVSGKEVLSGKLTDTHSNIDVSALEEGMYLLNIYSEGQCIQSRKLVIAR